jgi:hypothetical protein
MATLTSASHTAGSNDADADVMTNEAREVEGKRAIVQEDIGGLLREKAAVLGLTAKVPMASLSTDLKSRRFPTKSASMCAAYF